MDLPCRQSAMLLCMSPCRLWCSTDDICFCHKCSIFVQPQMLVIQTYFYIASVQIICTVTLHATDAVYRISCKLQYHSQDLSATAALLHPDRSEIHIHCLILSHHFHKKYGMYEVHRSYYISLQDPVRMSLPHPDLHWYCQKISEAMTRSLTYQPPEFHFQVYR
mgnify:CR=1 FL=1